MDRYDLFKKLMVLPFAPLPSRVKVFFAQYSTYIINIFLISILLISTIGIYPVYLIITGICAILVYELAFAQFQIPLIKNRGVKPSVYYFARGTIATILTVIGLAIFYSSRSPIWLLFVVPLWRVAENDPFFPFGIIANLVLAFCGTALYAYLRFAHEIEGVSYTDFILTTLQTWMWFGIISLILYIYTEFVKRVDVADQKRKQFSKVLSENLYRNATLKGWTDSILRAALSTTFAKYATFQLVNRHTGHLQMIAAFVNENNEAIPVIANQFFPRGLSITYTENSGSGITGHVAKLGKEIAVLDTATDKRYVEIFSDTRSEIAVPVFDLVNNCVGGVLNVEYSQNRPLMNNIEAEGQKATLLELSLILQDELTYILLSEFQELLRDSGIKISKIQDERNLAVASMETLYGHYNLPIAVWIIDNETKSRLFLETSRGLPAAYVKSKPNIPLIGSKLGIPLGERSEASFISIINHESADHWQALRTIVPSPRGMVLIPLRGIERPQGVIQMLVIRKSVFEKHELQLLTSFGHQIGTLIEAIRYRNDERLRGSLLASEITAAAHDLGNSLEILRNVSKVLSESTVDKKAMQALLSELAFINDIKNLVSFHSQWPSELPMENQLIEPMITRALSTLELRGILNSKAVIIRGLNPNEDKAYCNRVVVTGCIRNLLKNSTEAGYSKRPVEIIVERDDDKFYIIDVINYSSTIPEELWPKIFEPGFTTKKMRGSGFGLSSYKELLSRSRGSLELIHSSSLSGTKFRMKIPVEK